MHAVARRRLEQAYNEPWSTACGVVQAPNDKRQIAAGAGTLARLPEAPQIRETGEQLRGETSRPAGNDLSYASPARRRNPGEPDAVEATPTPAASFCRQPVFGSAWVNAAGLTGEWPSGT